MIKNVHYRSSVISMNSEESKNPEPANPSSILKSSDFMYSLLNNLPVPVFIKNIDLTFAGCNSAFSKLIGYSEPQLLGKRLCDLDASEHAAYHERMDKVLLSGQTPFQNYQAEVIDGSGALKHMMIRKTIYFNNQGKASAIVGVMMDITDHVVYQEVLKNLSLYDELTEVYNRRGFLELGSRTWTMCRRNHWPISVLMIDIDYFKKFNDTYGHQKGDLCLISVAQSIKKCCRRPGDMVCRYGGEEFLVILSDTPVSGAKVVAQYIQQEVYSLKYRK